MTDVLKICIIELSNYIKYKVNNLVKMMVYNLKKIETAKKMLAKKMPIDVIIEITGLSKDKIEKIKKEF